MRWCISIGAVLVAGTMAWGGVAGAAGPGPKSEQTGTKDNVAVDVELVIAVDISYSMDLDELAVQREGYAQAIVSKEFLQAMKTGPNGKVAVTYFEWSASSDQKIIISWRMIDGPETADVPLLVHEQTGQFDYLGQDFAKGGLLDGKEVWGFSPSTLTVYQGDTVDVTVVNPSGDDHTFTLPSIGFDLFVKAQTSASASMFDLRIAPAGIARGRAPTIAAAASAGRRGRRRPPVAQARKVVRISGAMQKRFRS